MPRNAQTIKVKLTRGEVKLITYLLTLNNNKALADRIKIAWVDAQIAEAEGK